MRHVYDCPIRWADMDLLGHVNNVVYVDYLQEARVDMLRHLGRQDAGPGLVEGLVVVRHHVEYLTPLSFDFLPVRIECWVTEVRAASFTMAYEVFRENQAGRTVYLTATTVLTPYVFSTETPRRLSAEEKAALADFVEPAPSPPRVTYSAPRHEELGHYPLHVRFSDVDVYGHVNNVTYLEYFMEARILLSARLWRGLPDQSRRAGGTGLVVAQADVDYRVPVLFRSRPYDAWSWVSRVGNRSMTIDSEICDGDAVLARSRVALVFFDPEAGRAVRVPERVRERLLEVVSPEQG